MNKGKILLGALLGVGLVVGLYCVNRYWIEPATKRTAVKSPKDHPLAPEFSLTDISGQKLSLADYKGKVVLLDFWATWCGPCRIEIPGFVELQKKYRDSGFAIIGISMDESVEPVREFYEEFRMNYPVALGSNKLAELYGGILGLPTAFLIGRDGRIYTRHVGAAPMRVFEDDIKKLLAAESVGDVAGPAEKITLGDAEEVNSEVPGVNLSRLSPDQKVRFKKVLGGLPCSCGCSMNLLKCRLDDRTCSVSRKLAREQLEKFSQKPV